MYIANIKVMPLAELLDPQGKAVSESLGRLGLSDIHNVRIGKHIVLEIEAPSMDAAYQKAEDACKKLLCNQVMESYEVYIEEAKVNA